MKQNRTYSPKRKSENLNSFFHGSYILYSNGDKDTPLPHISFFASYPFFFDSRSQQEYIAAFFLVCYLKYRNREQEQTCLITPGAVHFSQI